MNMSVDDIHKFNNIFIRDRDLLVATGVFYTVKR